MKSSATYNRNDCNLLRLLCIFGAVVTPIAKFVWSYSISPNEFFQNIISVVQTFLYSGLFLLLFAATYFVPLIRKHAYYFVYGLYLFATVSLVYALEYNNFSVQSILLMILFTASVMMVVKKAIHLIVYDLCTFIMILAALFLADTTSAPKPFLAFFFVVYYLFNYGFVRLKLNTQNALMKSEEEIQKLAFYDTLTGLPNRNQLNSSLQKSLAKSVEINQEIAVLFVDLDGFKNVNDTLGHYNGDILLQQVADRLMKCIRTKDMVSRYGGDEFVIILNSTNRANASIVAQRVLSSFSMPFHINDSELLMTPSVGMSMYPEDGDSVEELINHADLAMYAAKESGKNNYRYFSSQQGER